MKFSTLFFVAAAFARGSDNSALGSDEKPPIGKYEMYPVGSGVPWEPSGILNSIEPFEGITFVEAHPDQAANVLVEVFGGYSDNGNCAGTGVLLASSDIVVPLASTDTYTIETNAAPYVGYSELASGSTSWPQTRNGVIVGASFNVSDFMGPTGDGALFVPQEVGPKDIGQARLCVRTSLKLDSDGDGTKNYISFLDTRFAISVTTDMASGFDENASHMGISISIDPDSIGGEDGGEGNSVETNIGVTVQLETFLCGTPGVNDGKPSGAEYTLGQDFQICVGPAEREASNFELVDFQVVVCENANDRRIVVTDDIGDSLTMVIKNVAGSKGLVEGQVAGDSAIAFKTVVTPGFFKGGDAPPIKCRGEALVRYKDSQSSRLLTAEFEHGGASHSVSAGESPPASRDLQAGSARRELKAFAVTVGLSIDDDVADDLLIAAATTVIACRRWQSILFVAASMVAL